MLVIQSHTRPARIRNAIVDLIAAGVAEIKVAAAYTTTSGSKMLLDSVTQSVGDAWFSTMPKMLVTSFDFGITEPEALANWLSLENASVRVAGAQAIAAGNTTPARAFHPKIYTFHVGDQTSSVLVTSANLTARGFTSNTETGWLHYGVDSSAVDQAFSVLCMDTEPLTQNLLNAYEQLRKTQPLPTQSANHAQPVTPFAPGKDLLPLFRNAVETGQVDLFAFEDLWIQVEALQGGSQSQLELPRRGHRFFGFTFTQYNKPQNVTIGYPPLRMGSSIWTNRPLTWHGNNRMERLNLPTQIQGGPNYSNSAVMFRRLPSGHFELIVTPLDSDLAHAWAHASKEAGTLFRLGAHATTRLVGLL